MEGENQTCLRRDEKGEERTLERETTEHTHSRGTRHKKKQFYVKQTEQTLYMKPPK